MQRNPQAVRRERIREAIARLPSGSQRRYPPELRAAIADYCRGRVRNGIPPTRVCSELGVSHPTLTRLLDEGKAPGMRRVQIVPAKTTAEAGAALLVRGPAGIVVEGLDVEGVAALVRALA